MDTPMSSSLASTPAPLRNLDQLPGPRAWPFFGNLLQMRPARMHLDMERWSQRYGTLFRVMIARTPVLVLADHDTVNTVLRNRPDGFERAEITRIVSEELGGLPGVFLAEGATWRNQRRMVMAGFAPHAIKAYFPSLVKVALRLQTRWRGTAAAGRPIELLDDLKRYTVDIIAGLAFGTEVNTIDGGEDVIQRHLDIIMLGVARRSIAPFPRWRYLKLPGDYRLERSVAALREAIHNLIAAARQRMEADPSRRAHPPNLLEAMIAAADEGDSGVDDIAVAGNVSTMLLAGEDTTSNSLAWLLYLLRRNPAALARAREEVRRLAPDTAAFTIEQMDSLDFLDACVHESMRLKPVAPFLPLQALRDTVIGDVSVPKGTHIWCIMRHDSVDEAKVPQALAFDPERWLRPDEGAVVKRLAQPFGAGLRTCPGRYLALLEIKIAAAMLLSTFELEAVDTPDGGEARETMGFVMSPHGLTMRLRPRE